MGAGMHGYNGIILEYICPSTLGLWPRQYCVNKEGHS